MSEKDNLIKILESAIDVEYTTSFCFEYIASLIKNGRIKSKFYTFIEEAKRNQDYLINKLKGTGIDNFVLKEKCKFCKLNPESFSLLGAFNLGLEITDISIKLYHNLLDLLRDKEEKDLLRKIIKAKIKQRDFLKKEKRVTEDKETKDLISGYCIPEVISKLWH